MLISIQFRLLIRLVYRYVREGTFPTFQCSGRVYQQRPRTSVHRHFSAPVIQIFFLRKVTSFKEGPCVMLAASLSGTTRFTQYNAYCVFYHVVMRLTLRTKGSFIFSGLVLRQATRLFGVGSRCLPFLLFRKLAHRRAVTLYVKRGRARQVFTRGSVLAFLSYVFRCMVCTRIFTIIMGHRRRFATQLRRPLTYVKLLYLYR